MIHVADPGLNPIIAQTLGLTELEQEALLTAHAALYELLDGANATMSSLQES